MKKNVICLVIDSMGTDFLEMIPNKEELFLYRLMHKSQTYKNVFAQGPYTEAAVIGLQCGQRILDYNGYYNRLSDTPLTIFEAFKMNGYRTFSNTVQPHMHSKSLIRGITDYSFNVSPDFSALEAYRLNYYRRFFNSGLQSKTMIKEVIQLFEDYFNTTIFFEKEYISKGFSTSLINGYLNLESVKKNLGFLENEYLVFSKDREAYILDYYDKKPGKHCLSQNLAPRQDRKIQDFTTRKKIAKILHPVFKKERHLYSVLNRKNKLDRDGLFSALRCLINSPCVNSFKNLLKALYYNYLGKRFIDYKLWSNTNFDSVKNAPSIKTHIDHFLNWKKNINSNYFAYIHVDDIHATSAWFSYDSSDIDVVKKEANEASKFLDDISNTDVCGNINFLMGINHIDRVIENFYNELDKSGDLENTVLVITADHGYSIYQKPIRAQPINTFHPECYRVPVIIFNKSAEPFMCEATKQTFSIPNTLLINASLEENDLFYGKSLYKSEHNYVIQEFMGSGCPDMKRRPLLICYRDSDYSISISKKINDGLISKKDIIEYYNLKTDPLEQINIINKVSEEEIRKLGAYHILQERYDEICDGQRKYE